MTGRMGESNAAPDPWLASARAALARPPGEVAELWLSGGWRHSLRYESGERLWVEELGAEVKATARVWAGGRCGAASAVARLGQLESLLAEAAQAARSGAEAPPPPAWGGSFNAEDAAEREPPDGARGRAWLEKLIAPLEALGVLQAAVVGTTAGWTVLVDSRGGCALQLRPRTRGLVRIDTLAGALVDGVDVLSIGSPLEAEPVVERLTRAKDALCGDGGEGGGLEPGLPILMRPLVAAPLISGLAWMLRGDVALRSGMSRAIGRKLFPGPFTVRDGTLSPVDDEGQPCSAVTLVQDGVLGQLLHSVESAAAAKVAPNGRGMRAEEGGPPHPGAFRLEVAPRGALPELDHNELCARIELFTTMPRPSLVTLTAGGWVVRGGRRIRRIRPVEWELPLLETFRKLTAVGPDGTILAGADGVACPSLLFDAGLSQFALS